MIGEIEMRKNFGAKPYLYPLPVLVIATYNEDGSANAMNAAWGTIADYNKVALFLDARHKTVTNIMNRKAFTVAMADVSNLEAADFVGIVSGNNLKEKLAKTNWVLSKSEFVDAPLIEQLPLTLECQFSSYDEEAELLIGEIINVSADEAVLDDQGQIDPGKLELISYDPVRKTYLKLGGKAGNAFKDGILLK